MFSSSSESFLPFPLLLEEEENCNITNTGKDIVEDDENNFRDYLSLLTNNDLLLLLEEESSSTSSSNPGSVWSGAGGGGGGGSSNEEDNFMAGIEDFSESILFGNNPTPVFTENTNESQECNVEQQKRDPNTQLYHCPHCPKSFQYSSRLQRHMTAHAARKQFRCEVCLKHFSRKDVKDNHVAKVHKVVTSVDNTSQNNFECNVCKSRLKTKVRLDKHKRTHELQQQQQHQFTCQVCPKTFLSKKAFSSHVRLHEGERRFKCEFCGRGFLQKEFLIRHERTHTKVTPFKCSECEKSFSQEANLNHHRERMHSGNPKEHGCEFCDKSFRTAAELGNHVNYHKGVRGHTCTVCTLSFFEKRHLDRHLRRVHAKIRGVFCGDCGKTFYERFELNFHLKKSGCCSGKSNNNNNNNKDE